jgi:sugar-specific transcriptional regulator TrmB
MVLQTRVGKYLEKLGMEKELRDVLIGLIGSEPLTVLELSKKTSVPRTSCYRRLEELLKKGLIEELLDYKTKRYKFAGEERIAALIKEKELELEMLRDDLPNVLSLLRGQKSLDQPGTKVVFYKGREGVKQVSWNVLHTNSKEILSYLPSSFVKLVGKKFTEMWVDEFKLRKDLKMRELISDNYYRATPEMDSDFYGESYWNIPGIEDRYIPDSVLEIKHLVDIYEDQVTYFSFHQDDLYGVSIYNKELARMQRQLFELVWAQAMSMPKYAEWVWMDKSSKA